jgi:hypothetical protein
VTGIQEATQLTRFTDLRVDAYQGFIVPPVNVKL